MRMSHADIKAVLSILVLSAAVLASFSPSEAARKARGEVTTIVPAGGDVCQVLETFLDEKSRGCKTDGFPDGLTVVSVQSEKDISVKEDQPVILKAKDAGKSTGRVIQVIDLPADMKTLKETLKDRKCLVFWSTEKGKRLVIIQPDKDFLPEKGQQVKLKVKEVTKVEGC